MRKLKIIKHISLDGVVQHSSVTAISPTVTGLQTGRGRAISEA